MSTRASTDRRAVRHERTRREILDAAWALAERDGIAALSFREVAAEVGMRAPSLYTYFESKDALYDAMFHDGNQQLLDEMGHWAEKEITGDDPVGEVIAAAEEFIRFCQRSVARYQLLFTAAIPGWNPSKDSYALAEENLARSNVFAARAGITSDGARDVYTAIMSGLAAQQMANDLHGDRWVQAAPAAIRALIDAIERGDIP